MNLSRNHELVTRALAPLPSEVELLIEEPEPYGSAGTLATLQGRFSGAVVTRNADHLSDLSSHDLLDTHAASGARATLAVAAVDDGADLIIEDSAVKLVDRHQESRSGFMWIGASVFDASVIEQIEDERPLDLTRGVVAPLIVRGEVSLHVHEGYQLDVGTPGRYVRATQDVIAGRAPAPPVPLPGTIVEVDSGHAYVGAGAEVESSSLFAGAAVLAGARVHPDAQVERGIVWPGGTVPAGTIVRDAIWYRGSSISAL
jgi:mannose-1-phosphate guanylyltransferase